MASYHRKSHGGIVFSVALHIALVAALAVSVDMPWRNRQPPAAAPIQAEIIDAKAFEAEIKAKEDAARAAQEAEAKRQEEIAAAQRREEQQRIAREQEQVRLTEQRRQEQLAAEQKAADDARRADEARKAEEARKVEEARKAEEARLAEETRRKAEEARRAEEARLAEEARRRAEEARKAEEARLALELAEQQREAEAAARAAAARQTALDAYVRAITNHIERNWSRPPSAQPGLRCVVNVSQIPSGDIINSSIGACNGDEIVKRSIDAAVRLSSPLPRPSDPSLFQRNLEVIFAPVIQ